MSQSPISGRGFLNGANAAAIGVASGVTKPY